MKRVIFLMALLASSGCGSDSTSPTTLPPTSVAAQLVTNDLTVGTGAIANTGNTVTVAYTGWLYDTTKTDSKGSSFDSSSSFQFTIGGNVIAGWNQGVPGMKIGGTRRLIIPSALAYGSASPSSSIPPNASMVFDITLKSIP